ncbi:MAG: RNA 2'-phosphotransferase [Dysgonomonas sp.]|nr:RNA 2'-phosphotransferase [Dysgonomonas sp.]
MNEQHKKRIGKFLSLVLRHEPQKIGIELDENGWADVSELIVKCARKNIRFNMKELEEIVVTNDKKRYSFNEDKTKIRANQGHSINIDLGLTPVEPPEFLFHGTAERSYASIMEDGIKRVSRQHVHLSKDKETAHKVGSRHGRPIILTILSGQMYRDGFEFFVSENGVWLTDYVEAKYISVS